MCNVLRRVEPFSINDADLADEAVNDEHEGHHAAAGEASPPGPGAQHGAGHR